MHECSTAAHAVSVRTAMLFFCSVLNFLRSRLTREHIASYFSKCRGMAYTNPNAKVRKIFEILTILRGDLIEIFAEVTTFSPCNYN